MTNKKILIFGLVLVLISIMTGTLYAQTLPPGPPTPPPGVPIDGGITLLLAGLGGYAYKKFRDNKK